MIGAGCAVSVGSSSMLRPGVIALDAGQLRLLAEIAVDAALQAVEADAAALVARIDAQRVDAPGLLAGRRAGSAATRRAPPSRPRSRSSVSAAGGGPDGVPGIVLAAGDVVLDQVHLHAQRVDEELEGAALVVEGVEHDADEIVLEGAVAVGEAGADRRRLRIVGPEGDVEVLVVVGDPALGAHRRRDVVAPGWSRRRARTSPPAARPPRRAGRRRRSRRRWGGSRRWAAAAPRSRRPGAAPPRRARRRPPRRRAQGERRPGGAGPAGLVGLGGRT